MTKIPRVVKQLIRETSRDRLEVALQEQAYGEITAQIEAEQDPVTRADRQDGLDQAIRHASMKFTYIRDEFIPDFVDSKVRSREATERSRRRAKRELAPFALYAEIERILAKATAPLDQFGDRRTGPLSSRRWALSISEGYLEEGEANSAMAPSPETFRGSYYKFGAVNFYVGSAVEEIVTAIAARYGLDFRKLERKRSNPKNNS